MASGRFVRRFVITTAILVAVWWVLSGKFDLLHFGTGAATAFVIAATFPGWTDATRFRPLRCLAYIPWLMLQIVISNLRVARSVLSIRLRIAPTFISQSPGVTGDRALTTLASSLTLTPGTLTVDVSDHEIFVHALDSRSARDARDALIARRVDRVFEASSPPGGHSGGGGRTK